MEEIFVRLECLQLAQLVQSDAGGDAETVLKLAKEMYGWVMQGGRIAPDEAYPTVSLEELRRRRMS